jgi:cytochrome c peroxidase
MTTGWRRCWLGGALLLAACSSDPAPAAPLESALAAPSGFPAIVAPADNVPTAERIALGRELFYDERLSSTATVSCASCHVQAHAFADPNPHSLGVEEHEGTRNAPGLINEAWGKSYFWDGRETTLELQAVKPIENPLEMATSLEEVAARLSSDAEITGRFEQAYSAPPSAETIPRALASFVRSLISSESRYDAYLRGDASALNETERRGEQIFSGERGECFHCHVGYNLTSQGYRNDGIAFDDPDSGRFEITGKPLDRGKFKTPTLRNVGVSAPYMHDGALPTLEAVVDHYDAGGRGHDNTDPLIKPLGLSDTDKADLVAFLEALTDEAFLTNPALADPAEGDARE